MEAILKNEKITPKVQWILSIIIVLIAFYFRSALISKLESARSLAFSGAYDLSNIKSVGGNSIAEAYYQGVGEYNKGQYRFLSAIGNGIASLMIILPLINLCNVLGKFIDYKRG